MSIPEPTDPPSKEDNIKNSIFAGIKFGNMAWFMAWMSVSIQCDECGREGALPLLDKTFVCQECLERTNF